MQLQPECVVLGREHRLFVSLWNSSKRTDETGHDATDSRCDLEQVSDGLWVQQLILLTISQTAGYRKVTYGDLALSDDNRGILSSDGNGCNAGTTDSFEGIFWRSQIGLPESAELTDLVQL